MNFKQKMEWEQLVKLQDREKANQYYYENIWPWEKETVLARYQDNDFPAVYGLILMVGSSPEPLILTISILKPEKVFFIYTREFEKNMERIIAETVLAQRPTQIDKPSQPIDSSDITEIYRLIKDCWKRWHQPASEKGKKIVVDITGGKKSMVGGAAMAAALLNIPVTYVDYESYNKELRRPEPGSEYLRFLPNPLVTLGEVKKERAVSLFNHADYGQAAQLFCEIIDDLRGPQAQALYLQMETYFDLANAYHDWDNLDFIGAYHHLSSVINKIEKGFVMELEHSLSHLQRQKSILEILQDNQQQERALHNLVQNGDLKTYRQRVGELFFSLLQRSDFSQHLILTLLASASRIADRQQYSDAVMRLYRVLELVAQHRLALRGIQTDRPRLSSGDLQRVAAVLREMDRRGTEERFLRGEPMGILQSYIVLYALGDDVWQTEQGKEKMNINQFEQYTSIRNNLLAAHQNQRATEADYKRLYHFVERFVERVIPSFAERLREHQFIKLS